MKIIFALITILILNSCNNLYHEYEVFNKTKSEIAVYITTYGGKYQENLYYNIKPGERVYVFEHKDYKIEDKNQELFAKFIKEVKVINLTTNKEISKKFKSKNFERKYVDGVFGKYYIYFFFINEDDLN